MPAPLLTRDARELRQLARPRWQRRLIAWVVPIATVVLLALHTAFVAPSVCSAQTPCRPDPLGMLAVGLLVTAAVAAPVYPRAAAWFAGGFAVCLVVSERVVQSGPPSPVWLYVLDVGFVALCLVLAGVRRDRRATGRVEQWLVRTSHERPPAVSGPLPRPGRVWRAFGWALLVPALACLIWSWYAQREADARQRAAGTASAEVLAHVDEFTVEVRLGGERVRVDVADARQYPAGEQIRLYVDDRGLRQPVNEPYDATGWLFLAVLIGGVAIACVLRGRDLAGGPRRLFADAQPVSEVATLFGLGVVAVYAADARPGEPAIAEIWTASSDVDLFQPIGPALLYGAPIPGQWCTVAVDGVAVVPARQLLARRVTAPPFGVDPDDEDDLDEDGGEQPRLADLPLRPEEVSALRQEDRSGVRVHVRSPVVGYVMAAAMPLATIPLAKLVAGLPYVGWLAIAGGILAFTCVAAWRLFMRGRIVWDGNGLAVASAFGYKRVGWRVVQDIEYGTDTVTIHCGYRSFTVGAGPVWGVLGRRDRSAEDLANALRYARQTAVDLGDRVLDRLPQLDPPRAPAGLYLLWLLGTPVLALVLQAFSTLNLAQA